MKKILFPTDFSAPAHNAFRYAIELAKITNAKLDVINVYPEPLKGKDLYLAPELQRPLRLEVQTKHEARMADFISNYEYDHMGDQVVYPSEFTTDEIIKRSKKNCDLVIMGTKGERNALDTFMGSVTTETMKKAGCPVLAIPEGAQFTDIQKIAYASSLQANDTPFLQQLLDFAKTVKAEVHFLHVSETPTTQTQAQLDLLEKESAANFAQFHVINNPSVKEGVAAFLEANPAEILALFIPKRTLWDRLFHRSFSKQMTFHTNTPLFVFRE